jgi:hypothetical protein
MRFATTIPLRTSGGLNSREHHHARSRRVKAEREAGCYVTPAGFPLPCVVTLTRESSGTLDDDNLPGALKGVRDGIADKLGIKDNDPRVAWRYGQAKVPQQRYGVRIELETVPC